ncbi:MAG: alpha/beta hydrolase domain-containing protein, partial [Asticcacaulis sp.]
LKVPTGSGHGRVRFTFVAEGAQVGTTSTALQANDGGYCSRSTRQDGAQLRIKTRFDEPGILVPKSAWRFARIDKGKAIPDACFLAVDAGFRAQRLYELTYQGEKAPVVGLGLAAVRDFATALRDGHSEPLRPSDARMVLAYGYSQSGRFLRDYLYRGFNRRADGRSAFDGMLIFAAGAGRGSFDHRYAMPGEAGNSVMSALRPVDLYPFADVATPDIEGRSQRGLLDKSSATHTTPKIMYVYTSSEYWARGGSLLTTTADGTRDVPLAPESRLYVFSGSVHAPERPQNYLNDGTRASYPLNPTGDQFWAEPALLEDMRQWVGENIAPPPSVYPRVGADLVAVDHLGFPALKGVTPPGDLPPIWRLDFGPAYASTGVITRDPPALGARYKLLVPRVDRDGNELGGLHGVLTSVPLGTLTAWNWPQPGYRSFGVISQLGGAYLPFATDAKSRAANGDARPSLEERYGDKEGYLRAVGDALDRQIAARLLLPGQRADALSEASHVWDNTLKLEVQAPVN